MTQEKAKEIFEIEAIEKYPGLTEIHIVSLGQLDLGEDGKHYMFAILREDNSPLNIGIIAKNEEDEYHVFWNDTPKQFARTAEEEFGKGTCVEFNGFEYEDEEKQTIVPVYCAYKDDKLIGLGCFGGGDPVWWHVEQHFEEEEESEAICNDN